MVLGLTGGIATGKSTVSNMIRRNYDIEIIDVDIISRYIVETKEVINKLRSTFGEKIFKKGTENELNREKLRKLVFSSDKKLNKLNEITHKAILDEVECRTDKLKKQNKNVLIDMPLLFEVKFEDKVDQVLVVTCDENIERERLKERDGISEQMANQMIDSQMSLKDKVKKADYVIKNNGTKEDLFFEMQEVMQSILGFYGK